MKPLAPRPRSRFAVLTLALVSAIALMAAIRTCSTRHDGPAGLRPSGGDTLDVAIEYGPMSLYRYADTLGGFSYDFIRMVADSAGIPLKFHPVTVPGRGEEGLASGLYDIVVAALPATSSADSAFAAFTAPVYLDRQVLVQRRDSTGGVEITSQLQLARHEVWVMADTPIADRLRNLSAEIGDTIYIVEDPSYGSEQLVIMTATGDIPCAVVTEATAKALAPDYPDLDVSTAVSFNQFQAWKMRRSDTLLRARLDSTILRLRTTPAYATLRTRYTQ